MSGHAAGGVGLEELKTVSRADVYKAGHLAGHLTRNTDGGVDFTYTDEWVSGGGPAVAA